MTRFLIVALIIFSTSCLFSQEVVYFNEDWVKTSKDSAVFFGAPEKRAEGVFTRFYRNDSTIAREGLYKDTKDWQRIGELRDYDKRGVLSELCNYREGKKDGVYTSYYQDGSLCFSGRYKMGVLVDTAKTYYRSGGLKRLELYEKGRFVSGNLFTKTGADTTFYLYEEPASFVGGNQALAKFIQKNIKYPRKARRRNIQGKVFVKFIIATDGSVESAVVIKHVDPLLDLAAIDVVKSMPKWIPARIDGKPVKCYFNLPISFRLTD